MKNANDIIIDQLCHPSDTIIREAGLGFLISYNRPDYYSGSTPLKIVPLSDINEDFGTFCRIRGIRPEVIDVAIELILSDDDQYTQSDIDRLIKAVHILHSEGFYGFILLKYAGQAEYYSKDWTRLYMADYFHLLVYRSRGSVCYFPNEFILRDDHHIKRW